VIIERSKFPLKLEPNNQLCVILFYFLKKRAILKPSCKGKPYVKSYDRSMSILASFRNPRPREREEREKATLGGFAFLAWRASTLR
jgi:hypothetical protein